MPTAELSTLESKYRRAKMLNVILAACSVFLLVVALAPQAKKDAPSASSAAVSEKSPDGVELRDPDDQMAIGDPAADVVMTWWTDMRCPFCAVFNQDRLPAIMADYVDTGKVRIKVREAPFFGPESELAAVAARAAARQGKFAAYLTTVYENAPESGKPDLPPKQLVAFADEAGVPDLQQFGDDLQSAELRNEVRESLQSAQKMGVNSVPYFTIGGSVMAGAQPENVFRSYIDQALQDAK